MKLTAVQDNSKSKRIVECLREQLLDTAKALIKKHTK